MCCSNSWSLLLLFILGGIPTSTITDHLNYLEFQYLFPIYGKYPVLHTPRTPCKNKNKWKDPISARKYRVKLHTIKKYVNKIHSLGQNPRQRESLRPMFWLTRPTQLARNVPANNAIRNQLAVAGSVFGSFCGASGDRLFYRCDVGGKLGGSFVRLGDGGGVWHPAPLK